MYLKGLSHEKEFKKFWQKFTELCLTKWRGWFLIFLEAPMILKCKKYIYCGWSSFTLSLKQEPLGWGNIYTVTRLDVIFRYTDRVPLTHFVHRAKKVFSMWAWIICWDYCATGIFRRCNGKVFEHRMGANLRPYDYELRVLPLRHCSLVWEIQLHLLCYLLRFSGRFCCYRKPNFPAVSGSYLPGFSGLICSYWQPNFPALSGSYLPGFSGRIR